MNQVGVLTVVALSLSPVDGFAASHPPLTSLRQSSKSLRPQRLQPPTALARGSEPDLVERAFAAVVYALPVLDGFEYGTFVYNTVFPQAYALVPFVNAFESLPFAGLILFIGLSTFTRNQGLSRFVRFNIQQALLLDILLIIPGAFGGAARMFPAELQIIGSNFVFYAMALTVSYSVFCIVQGKTPDRVPILSDAANMQIGPF